METKSDKAQVQLQPNELQLFDYISSRHDAKIQQGVRPEDLLVPAFWAHHAMKLKPMDEIRAHAEDGTWVAYFLVLDCSRTWAKVKQLSFHNLGTADVALTQTSEIEVKAYIEQHEVKHRGPHRWSVVRKSDKAVLQEGMGQRDEAEKWLDRHAREQIGVPQLAHVEPATVPA